MCVQTQVKQDKTKQNNKPNVALFKYFPCHLIGLPPVVIRRGCHNKIPWTSSHNRNVFSQFLGLEFRDQGTSTAGFWWRRPSWLADGCLLARSSHAREREISKLSGVSSCKNTNSILRAPPSGLHLKLIYLPQAPSPKTITLGTRASTQEFCGNTIQSIVAFIQSEQSETQKSLLTLTPPPTLLPLSVESPSQMSTFSISPFTSPFPDSTCHYLTPVWLQCSPNWSSASTLAPLISSTSCN